jgi:hypothetical protein
MSCLAPVAFSFFVLFAIPGFVSLLPAGITDAGYSCAASLLCSCSVAKADFESANAPHIRVVITAFLVSAEHPAFAGFGVASE